MKRGVQLSILIELIFVSTAFAQWRVDGIQVAPSTTATATRSDGAGGILVAWRSGSNIYVQGVDHSGTKLWNASGVVVCSAAGLRYTPNVASDGAGGAFVTWLDERNGSSNRAIYVQRVSAAGLPQWAVDGVAISPPVPTSTQYVPAIITDGSGAIIAWADNRTGDYNIYAQRLDASGAAQWFANGVPVCTAAQDQYFVRMRAGTSIGQALLCWVDQRNNSSAVYGQALGPGGVPQWGSNGAQAGLGSPDVRGAPVIDTDGAGGGIVTWADANMHVYAQRIVAGGGLLWGLYGMPICAAAGAQTFPTLCATGSGGVDIAWCDERNGPFAVYAQRVDASGTHLWTIDGVLITATLLIQGMHAITTSASGTFVTWCNGIDDVNGSDMDIYAQKLNAAGVPQWAANGIPVCADPDFQEAPVAVPDLNGGVICAWRDYRGGTPDVYAERVTSAGVQYAFVVTKEVDDNTAGTLRIAIAQANGDPGPQTISFDIPGFSVHTIQPVSAFPIITDALTIDGFTQPGASPNPTPVGAACDAQIMIEIDGSQFGYPRGFQFLASNCSLRGVAMFGCYIPVTVSGSNAVIEGNYLGFRADGQIFGGNPGDGVIVTGPNCRVGGASAAARNVIGGFRSGVYVYGVSGTQIYGNYIGISPNLASAQPNQIGVWLLNGGNGAKIGSSVLTLTPNSQEGNFIANNSNGIVMQDAGTVNNMVIGNSILANTGSAIDLGYDGSTYNDRNDADSGPNNKQNQPVITSVSASQIDGFMDGIPNQVVQIHFYRSPSCSVYGRGNAFTYIGGVTVGGLPNFSFHPAQPLPPGSTITCTATDLSGNTSEFTDCIQYQNTGSGSNVTVNLTDSNGNVLGTTTYASVTGAGNTFIANPYTPPVPVSGYAIGNPNDPQIYFNITTNASYTGGVDVCLNYDESHIPGPEANLVLLHYDGTMWQNVTTSRDPVNNKVCGHVTSLSPFVIGAVSTTGVNDHDVPATFALHANVPNPFNPVTTISYDVPARGADVNISIYDVSGRLVRELVHEHRTAGVWSVQWNGDDDRGQRVASGVYFYRMRAGEFVDTKKMVLLK